MSPLEVLTDHTYRMVTLGTMSIGMVAGALGCFAYLRRQSLVSDLVSHAALPGSLLAFLAAVAVGADGRGMIALVLGAAVVGTLAVLVANSVTRASTLGIDTAMVVVLTLFFGAGTLLMRVIANSRLPGKGGIQDYLLGNASVFTVADLVTSLGAGALAVAALVVFWKELALRAFDPELATVLGFRAGALDALMFGAIAIATVIGVKTVGLVLTVAFVVTPPAAARQWTVSLGGMVVLAGLIGALGSGVGAYLSIALGKVPSGPVVVLVLGAILLVSLLASPRRSLAVRAVARARARRALARELAARGEGR
ncbi:metal ABC transporter permease [Actinomyces howellii]|uniref:Manganese transport system membrane protein mntB n=1 Tax=Actinomyces howellii TaxID=52771 RepID=A0A448HDD5_9ACTO|nr:metal ABC transporter permease [Actinomyces howellii]VEG25413.1 Manganese transport system membrane protein mntB [Actinomyces howellii]